MTSAYKSLSAITLSGTLVLGAALLGASSQALADDYHDTSAGGACQPAVEYGGTALQFTNHYLINNSTTDKYVVCHFAMDDEGGVKAPMHLVVYMTAGAVGGTGICNAQTGFHAGPTNVAGTSAGSVALAAGATGPVEFNEAALVRPTVYYVLTMNCRVPGGWKMGLIQYHTAP